MIALLEAPFVQKVYDRSPGLYRLGEALSELLSRYDEQLPASDELPEIVVEDSPDELCLA